jgi:hypothetical protein
MLRRYEPIASGAWFSRARYRRGARILRRVRRKVRKVVWTGERGLLVVGLVVAVIAGYFIGHLGA